jgi:hypothetical protein
MVETGSLRMRLQEALHGARSIHSSVAGRGMADSLVGLIFLIRGDHVALKAINSQRALSRANLEQTMRKVEDLAVT